MAAEGFFTNVQTGEDIAIDEHASDVMDNPTRFGLTREDIVGLSAYNPKHREVILRKVLDHGFIRVRGRREYWVFEHSWKNKADVLFQIIRFAQVQGLGEYSTVDVHNINNPHDNFSAQVKDLTNVDKASDIAGFSVLDHKLITNLNKLAETLGIV